MMLVALAPPCCATLTSAMTRRRTVKILKDLPRRCQRRFELDLGRLALAPIRRSRLAAAKYAKEALTK